MRLQNKQAWSFVLMLGFVLLMAGGSSAQGTEVRFTFSGTVNYVDCGGGDCPAPWDTIAVGDPWSVTYCFESTTPDSDSADPHIGEYYAILTYTLTIGNASLSGSGPELISVFYDLGAGVDEYMVGLNLPDGSSWTLVLIGSNVFSSDALPLCGGINLSSFLTRYVSLVFAGGPTSGEIDGTVDTHDCGFCPMPPTAGACCYFAGGCDMVPDAASCIGGEFLGLGHQCTECPCYVPCPEGGTPEPEDCGADTDGGCNAPEHLFAPIACGETVCGTTWADPSLRDSDWYRVVADEGYQFTWTAEGEVPLLIFVLKPGPNYCDDLVILNSATGAECTPVSISTTCLGPGEYWFWVGPSSWDDWPCDKRYTATLSCATLEDCNLNGIPDACECLPTQAKLADGGGSGGPTAQSTWTMTATLLRAWFQRIGRTGDEGRQGSVNWKSRTTNDPLGSYANRNIGLKTFELQRTAHRKQHCGTSNRTYRWIQFNQDVLFAEGVGDSTPPVELRLFFQESHWVMRPLIATAGSALTAVGLQLAGIGSLSSVSTAVQSFWTALNNVTTKSRDIGMRMLMNYPYPTAGSQECNDYLNCEELYLNDVVGTEYALDGTIKSKPAKVQIAWQRQFHRASLLKGQRATDPVGDSISLSPENDLVLYEYGQHNCCQLFCRAQFAPGADLMQFSAGQDRTVDLYFDIDNNPNTGCPTSPGCGAEYDVRGYFSNNGTDGLVYTQAEILSWCDNAWQPTGNVPDEFEPLEYEIRWVLSTRSLGICEPDRQFASWIATSLNGTVQDTDPNEPCDTTQRLRIPLVADTDCLKVSNVLEDRAPDSSITALRVQFSAPINTPTLNDIGLFLPGPIPVPFTFNISANWTGLEIWPSPGPSFPAGRLTLRLNDPNEITDLAGNHLDGTANGTGTCDGSEVREFCSPEVALYTSDAGGTPKTAFANNGLVYARGSAFAASTPIRLYVIAADSATTAGVPFIDQTDNGSELVTTTGAGDLPTTNLGHPVPDAKYQLVADVNCDGFYDPVSDRIYDTCDGFLVGQPCPDTVEEPIAYYPLNEAYGTLYAQEMISGMYGQLIGGPLPVPGMVNGALQFNGQTAYVEVPDNDDLNLSGDFTIELWVNVAPGTDGGGLVSKDAGGMGYAFDILGSAGAYHLALKLEDGAQTFPFQSDAAVPLGQWAHVAVAGSVGPDGTSVTFYINGNQAGHASANTGAIDNTSPFWLGNSVFAGLFEGSLDEVSLYDVTLSAAQIQTIYANGPAGKCLPEFNWCENFDSYALGQVIGQGGWQGWDNNPAAGALVNPDQAHSAPNSVAIAGASDLVHPYAGVNSGRWIFTAWQYVPPDFVTHCDPAGNCGSYLMLLNTYQDGGPYSWTVALHADSITHTLIRDDAPAASLPLVQGAWAQIQTVIDFDNDSFRVFYNGTELGTEGSWTNALPWQPTPGVLNLGALDLFANQSTVVYYDDICLHPIVFLPGDLNCDGTVGFGDINPFVLALSNPGAWETAYPGCYLLNGDINGDGLVDFGDINPFVALLAGG